MTRQPLALLAIAALGAALGCAASNRAENPGAAWAPVDARKDDIRDLWMQIREWRVELAMPADPTPGDKALLAQAVKALRRCPATDAAEGACGDVCNLKDAICDNADSICRIADELGDDAWAAGKCTSAKASCKEATDRCCGCTEDAARPADATR
jgi:hypothetical protein